ncbi:hypothetical protein AV650_25765 [Serratia fonticola]|nr:hypothetical protein AV650_25765 [Serratia fonticola]
MIKLKVSDRFGVWGFAFRNDQQMKETLDFMSHLENETEKSKLSIIMAYIDDLLSRTMLAFFFRREEGKKLIDGVDGPIGAIAAKARTAYALGLISKTQKDNIINLSKIRNLFSHRWNMESFDDGEVIKFVNKLKINEENNYFEVTNKAKINIAMMEVITALLHGEDYAIFFREKMISSKLSKLANYGDKLQYEKYFNELKKNKNLSNHDIDDLRRDYPFKE